MSERKINFAAPGRTKQESDWAAHRQSHWLDFAGNPNFPDYLRIVFVAYARHRANGHAVLDQGELATFLVRKDGTLPNRRTMFDAMQKAIRLEYLTPASRILCLVVSSDHAQIGVGDPDEPCKRDHTVRRQRKSASQKDRSDAGRFVSKDRAGDGPLRANDRAGDGPSTLRPFSLLCPATDAPASEPASRGEAIA